MEKNIIEIEKELVLQTYKSSSFSVFVVTEPKTREVFAAEFKDRVVHHLLTDYLQPYFEPKFIHHSYACRNEKGTHMAVKSLGKLIKKITKNNTQKAYYLQADVKSFFPSINHNILFNLIKNKVKNPYFIWLTQNIIYFDCTINPTKKGQLSLFAKVPPHKSLFTVPKGKGLPIGNLTSQFFANVYLNELDQFVKHKLKCKYYIRYVDDFIIMSQNKNELFVIKHKIETFLHEKLDLELHPNKWKVEDVRNGIDTLGYITKPNYKLVRKRVIKSLNRKLFEK